MTALDALLLHRPGNFHALARKALGDGPTQL